MKIVCYINQYVSFCNVVGLALECKSRTCVLRYSQKVDFHCKAKFKLCSNCNAEF